MNTKPLSQTLAWFGWLPLFLLTGLICARAMSGSVLSWKQDKFVALKGN